MSYNSKYTGKQVEDLLDQVASGNAGGGGGGGIAVETDPVFSASPAAGITEEQIVAWDDLAEMVNLLDKDVATLTGDVQEVQESLTDLDTIRSGAAKGATAVQPEDIEDVARLDEEYVVANGIVSKEDVYYHLPNTNTSDAAHTLATKDDVSSAIETYVADFTIQSLRDGIYDGTDVECDIRALVDAMNANKVILVREDKDSSYKGVYVLNGYAEDLLYFSIVDISGNIFWCEGTDYKSLQGIDARTLYERSWDYKQDTLVSGENIKTINGESILGGGDITIEGGVGTITGVSANGTSIATSGVADIPAASTSKYGVTKLTTLTNSSSTTLAATASAVKIAYDLANSKQDRLESGTNIKTINGQSLVGEGNIEISGGKTAFDTFMDNIDVDYAYDSSTGANYTVIRVYKTKLDGTKQYPFVVVPDANEIKYSTLDFMERFADDNGYLFAINSGLGSPATHKIDGIAVQNGVVVNNVPAVYHSGSMPLTIDANGDLSYAESNADANELVASGIVSAICGFCPIIVDYNTVSPPTVSNVSHFTQNAQRQIIGQFGNGDYAIITCEGRNFNNSDGWTIAEAQTICKKLGLKFAYNLDGGGSTQTVIGKKQLNIIYENEKGRTLPSFIVFNGRSELGVMPDVPDVQVTLESISATYSGGDVEVGTDLTTLTGVVVTATYSDGSTVTVSGYTLSGEIAEGENVITVSYRGKTTTFTVVGITGTITNKLVWVVGTTDPNGTWVDTSENHRGALYTTENTGSIVALDIDSNSAVNAYNVPSGLTGKLYLPRIPEGATKLSWSNSDSNVLEAVWLRDSSGAKIAEVNTSYTMVSPIDLTKYPTAVYWNCDVKYGNNNAKIYANPDSGDSTAYNRYQIVCNTKFTFS